MARAPQPGVLRGKVSGSETLLQGFVGKAAQSAECESSLPTRYDGRGLNEPPTAAALRLEGKANNSREQKKQRLRFRDRQREDASGVD